MKTQNFRKYHFWTVEKPDRIELPTEAFKTVKFSGFSFSNN